MIDVIGCESCFFLSFLVENILGGSRWLYGMIITNLIYIYIIHNMETRATTRVTSIMGWDTGYFLWLTYHCRGGGGGHLFCPAQALRPTSVAKLIISTHGDDIGREQCHVNHMMSLMEMLQL